MVSPASTRSEIEAASPRLLLIHWITMKAGLKNPRKLFWRETLPLYYDFCFLSSDRQLLSLSEATLCIEAL